jgi:drug/metabolite transporter (DMT)-like permease
VSLGTGSKFAGLPRITPSRMSASEHISDAAPRDRWLANRPFVLLAIAALCWAGNAIVGRLAVGHIPPVTLAFLRWGLGFVFLLPVTWTYLKRDWTAIRGRFGLMFVISLTGIAGFNTMQYWALEHTQALNTLLLQSAGPLFVAGWSLMLFGIRLTLAQAIGIVVSLTGVLVILLHGDLTAIAKIDFNKGDLIFTIALLLFGLYTVLSMKRPPIHDLSFLAFTFACGATILIPPLILELMFRPVMQFNVPNFLSTLYVAIFPSTIAYLCYNRGVRLIGANRAAPFFHVVPLFGSVMAIVFLGETPQLFHFIGFALVVAGVIVASRKPSVTSS